VDPSLEASRQALATLASGTAVLEDAGIGVLALALDAANERAQGAGAPAPGTALPASVSGDVPVVHATRDVALSWALLYRHLFMNRQPLPLPTLLLLDADGQVARVWRGIVDVDAIVQDAQQLD